MPTPEVIGAMRGVQDPFKIDAQKAPDDILPQQLLDASDIGSKPVVECDSDMLPGALFGIQDSPALGVVNRHWLLGNDIAAEFQGTNDVLVVKAVDGGDDHTVR